jgi:hypothetical protein
MLNPLCNTFHILNSLFDAAAAILTVTLRQSLFYFLHGGVPATVAHEQDCNIDMKPKTGGAVVPVVGTLQIRYLMYKL